MALALAPVAAGAAPAIRYVSAVPEGIDVIVDARAAKACEAASLPGARCLPVRDLLGPHNRLANPSGLLWALGTAGLTGRERVLVAGAPSLDRDFLAGLLFIAGQRQVLVLRPAIARLGRQGTPLQPGTARAMTREAVWQAPMRADRIVLGSEIAAALRKGKALALVDGRPEAAYWGKRVRAQRGGHLPGAQNLPLAAWKTGPGAVAPMAVAEGVRPIVYGHDARDGLALLARAVALGVPARVYLEGWSAWAAHGAYPADAVTYPDMWARSPALSAGVGPPSTGAGPRSLWPLFAAMAVGAVLAGGGFFAGLRLGGGGWTGRRSRAGEEGVQG